jgi:hypothetical protein
MPKTDLIMTHHNVGRWIRNNCGLWSKEGALYQELAALGLHHPDDMSSVIIKEFWLQLNHQPSEIDEDVKKYKKYWDNSHNK